MTSCPRHRPLPRSPRSARFTGARIPSASLVMAQASKPEAIEHIRGGCAGTSAGPTMPASPAFIHNHKRSDDLSEGHAGVGHSAIDFLACWYNNSHLTRWFTFSSLQLSGEKLHQRSKVSSHHTWLAVPGRRLRRLKFNARLESNQTMGDTS